MRSIQILFVLFATTIFCQTLYISPAMDLALSVYEPFVIVQTSRPGEIGLFKLPTGASTIQIVSFTVSATTTLNELIVATKQPAMKERSAGSIKIVGIDCFFRWFSIDISGKSVQSFQLMFLRYNKAYLASYLAPEEEFYRYMIPALLTLCSIKGSTFFNYVDEKHSYRLVLHEPFSPAKIEQGEIGSFVAVDGEKIGYIQIVQEKLPKRMKVNEYADLVEKNTLSKLKDYRSFSFGRNMVEGNEFFWRIFSFVNEGTTLSALQLHLIVDEFAITLTYLSKIDSFERFLPAAVGTMFSFKK
ncbi:hypothetical protein [Pseudothermotoga sp.]|uniref:hypothetical protein n=1 Tax=Pseudothermotoga sp. TaxID=2033661 RepID=UPI0031F6AC4C